MKQGGVLSPVLFVFIDGLLSAVCASRIGCSIGTMFVGITAYADDIVLLAPTAACSPRARHMQQILVYHLMLLSLSVLCVYLVKNPKNLTLFVHR